MSLVGSIVFIAILYAIYIFDKRLRAKKPLVLNKDSVVVLTGGCDGLGRLTALNLAQKYQVKLVIIDIQHQKFQALQKELESLGSQVQCLQCDLSNIEQIDKVVNQIRGKYPQIDLLVNNAGIAFQKQITDASSYKKNLKVFHINYFAPCHLFIELLDQLKGHVVTIASIASIIRGNKIASYVASKAAIYAFFNSARVQLLDSRPNITMSLVCPWAIDTGMFQGFKTKIQKIIPLLKPDDVTKVIHDVIINRPQVTWIPSYIGIITKILNILPDYYLDRLFKWTDTSAYTNNRENINLKNSE